MGVLCGGWSHGAWLHGVRPHGSRPHARKVTKALLLPEPGDCETVTVGELPIPEPGPGEIRVKVRASGFNPSDFQRAGYELPGAPYPFVLGIDVAGGVDLRNMRWWTRVLPRSFPITCRSRLQLLFLLPA